MKIWKQIKISLKLLIRFKNDFLSKDLFEFSKPAKGDLRFDYSISIAQEIKPGETFENKMYNILLASKRINKHVLQPRQIFSFFKIVGNPNLNFKKSRTLVNGKLEQENGGGMCQVSGIVYQMSLIAGLEILERHNHSVDIYTTETRFAPLGCDATIVYGYKDLRIKNNFLFAVKFEIEIIENFIYVNLWSEKAIEKQELLFESIFDKKLITVNVFNSDRKLLNQSKYQKMS
ncbi:VanW family protein [Flavobacterium sp. N2038]|uniref:VanW family protein n=1 Tax=Flavobacterium sp. N2038 TaxID=2986829 RepID=UPI0022246695|nr:VanW family protein [Flavobacterium sp. N2038]